MYEPLPKTVVYLFFGLIFFKLLDIGTTAYGVATWGIAGEANPLMHWMMVNVDVVFALLFSYAMACVSTWLALLYLLHKKATNNMLTLVAAVTVGLHIPVVVNNFYQLSLT